MFSFFAYDQASAELLHHWADIASVATFILAAIGSGLGLFGYIQYLWDRLRKRRMMEDYLKRVLAEKLKDDDGTRSTLRIISEIGLTEDEIIQSSFRSKHISRHILHNERGITDAILFRYK